MYVACCRLRIAGQAPPTKPSTLFILVERTLEWRRVGRKKPPIMASTELHGRGFFYCSKAPTSYGVRFLRPSFDSFGITQTTIAGLYAYMPKPQTKPGSWHWRNTFQTCPFVYKLHCSTLRTHQKHPKKMSVGKYKRV